MKLINKKHYINKDAAIGKLKKDLMSLLFVNPFCRLEAKFTRDGWRCVVVEKGNVIKRPRIETVEALARAGYLKADRLDPDKKKSYLYNPTEKLFRKVLKLQHKAAGPADVFDAMMRRSATFNLYA